MTLAKKLVHLPFAVGATHWLTACSYCSDLAGTAATKESDDEGGSDTISMACSFFASKYALVKQ